MLGICGVVVAVDENEEDEDDSYPEQDESGESDREVIVVVVDEEEGEESAKQKNEETKKGSTCTRAALPCLALPCLVYGFLIQVTDTYKLVVCRLYHILVCDSSLGTVSLASQLSEVGRPMLCERRSGITSSSDREKRLIS